MKPRSIWTALGVLALAAGICTFTPKARAQSQKEDPNQQQAQGAQQKTETFVGQVIKAKDGRWALLMDKSQGKGYFLDDDGKAKQFEGQNVKVIGVLEASTGTIHVTDILPA